jgi:hypothetical protein
VDFFSIGDMVEFVGAILGDGNIHGKRPKYVELTGDPRSDLGYFQNVLIPTVIKNLGRNPKLICRSRGLRFRVNHSEFVDWLAEIGISAGKARGKARIPDFIVSDHRLFRRCIRGVYDTDGSVYFDVRPIYRRPYPRVELHMTNFELLEQVMIFLNSIGIKCSLLKKGSVETSGTESLKLFLENIGFANTKHVNRIRLFYPELLKFNSTEVHLKEGLG